MKLKCLLRSYACNGLNAVFQGEVFEVPEDLGKRLLADYPKGFELVGQEKPKMAEPKKNKMMVKGKNK